MPSATVLGQSISLSSTSHPPTHTACGLTEDGDGNPGTILVRWLGPALQCLIGQLVLVMSPLAGLTNAITGCVIKASAPLSRLPCAG